MKKLFTILIISIGLTIVLKLFYENGISGIALSAIVWKQFLLSTLFCSLLFAAGFVALMVESRRFKAEVESGKKTSSRALIILWVLNVIYWFFTAIAISTIFRMEKKTLPATIGYYCFMAVFMGTIFYFSKMPLRKRYQKKQAAKNAV